MRMAVSGLMVLCVWWYVPTPVPSKQLPAAVIKLVTSPVVDSSGL